jgi:hypothetical protein
VLGVGQPGVLGQPSDVPTDNAICVSGYGPYGSGTTGHSDDGYGLAGIGHVRVFAQNAVHGNYAYLASDCCAGDFYGDVVVHRRFAQMGGAGFQIDHPRDPANKSLARSTVESSEMKNVYDGVVVEDRGGATVELPDWFEALNADFRYQLTSIGLASRNLHVANEIAGNRFEIAGGLPGQKVCWLVTGVHQDPWASAHPVIPEQMESGVEVGSYAHPELYGGSKGEAWRPGAPRSPGSVQSDRPQSMPDERVLGGQRWRPGTSCSPSCLTFVTAERPRESSCGGLNALACSRVSGFERAAP